MIKESKPTRSQEQSQVNEPEGAAFHNTEGEGASLKAPSYNPTNQNSGANYVQQMQAGLGTSLADTKVVKNSPKAKAMNAKAFAEGNKIHFSPGQYQPDTKSGQEVLGHEIIHSIQQRQGKVKATESHGGQKVNNDVGLENQANSERDRIAKGNMASAGLQNAPQMQGEAPAAQGFGFLKKIGSSISSAASSVFNAGKKAVSGVKNIATKTIQKGTSFVKKGLGVAGNIFNKAKGFAKGVVNKGIGMAKNAAASAWSGAKKTLNVIKSGGGILKDAVNSGMSWIKSKVEKGMDVATAVTGFVKDKFKSVGSKVWNGMKKIASDPVGSIKGVLEGIANSGSAAWSWMKGVGSKIKNTAQVLFKKIKKIGKRGFNYLKNVGNGVVGVLKSVGGGVFNGIKQIFSGDFLGGLKTAGMGIVEGIMGGIDTFLDATAGLFDSFLGPEGTQVKEDEIPARHVMDEFAAHRLAYKKPSDLLNGAGLSPQERSILEKGGYDPDAIDVKTGPNGFQAVLIMPAEDGVLPMLSIRGTADAAGAITDIDPDQVGDFQYKNNAATIAAMIESAGGKVDLSGHSLGGAMAQIIAAHHTSAVGRVTTFQAPGVSKKTANLYKSNLSKIAEEDRPEVAHHTVNNDLVSKAGEENLPGTIYEHDLGNIDPLTAHTSFVTATSGFEESRNQYGITDDFMENEVGQEINDETIITKFEEQPHKYKRLVAEFVRGGIGDIRELLVGAYDSAKKVGSGIKKLASNGKTLVKKLINLAKKKGKSGLRKIKGFFKSIIGG